MQAFWIQIRIKLDTCTRLPVTHLSLFCIHSQPRNNPIPYCALIFYFFPIPHSPFRNPNSSSCPPPSLHQILLQSPPLIPFSQRVNHWTPYRRGPALGPRQKIIPPLACLMARLLRYIHPHVSRNAQVDVPCRQTIIRRNRVELFLTVTLRSPHNRHCEIRFHPVFVPRQAGQIHLGCGAGVFLSHGHRRGVGNRQVERRPLGSGAEDSGSLGGRCAGQQPLRRVVPFREWVAHQNFVVSLAIAEVFGKDQLASRSLCR